MLIGTHLTTVGFEYILTYYAAINLGASTKLTPGQPLEEGLKSFFPNLVPVLRGIAVLPSALNPFRVSGFIAGDGSFVLGVRSSTSKLYYSLSVAQHIRDLDLMTMLINFFGGGSVYSRPRLNRCDFIIQTSTLLLNSVIPHFDLYPLSNIKELDYQDFKEVMGMLRENTVTINWPRIKAIISGINSKRVH